LQNPLRAEKGPLGGRNNKSFCMNIKRTECKKAVYTSVNYLHFSLAASAEKQIGSMSKTGTSLPLTLNSGGVKGLSVNHRRNKTTMSARFGCSLQTKSVRTPSNHLNTYRTTLHFIKNCISP